MIIDFYGDSFTYGYDGANPGVRVPTPYPARVQTLMSQHIIRNEGVNSNDTTKMLAGTDGQHPTWSAQMANTDADVVVIASCFNDSNAISVAQYESNLTTMHSQAVAAGKIVVFQTCHQVSASFGNPALHAATMRTLADNLGIGCIDLYLWSLENFTGTLTAYLTDGYHPNQSTYTMIGEYIARKLHDAISVLDTPYGLSNGWNFARTFFDEFDGGYDNTNAQGLDADNWAPHAFDGVDDSTQNYEVTGGVLKIWPESTFIERTITADPAILGAGSGFAQRYGYYEAKIKMPYGKGLTPIFTLYNHEDQNVGSLVNTYTRDYFSYLRTFDFSGDDPFVDPTTGQPNIQSWLYSNVEDAPVTNAGVDPWITKTTEGGVAVTKFLLDKDDNELYGHRTQFSTYRYEMQKRYRVDVEFKLDSTWDLNMGTDGEGLLWQCKGQPKSGQFSNASMSLNITDNELWFSLLYPYDAYNATSWPGSFTWTNTFGAGGYVSTAFSRRTIAVDTWYKVTIEFFADDRPSQYGGQGYCIVKFNDQPWIDHTGPNHHPDQLGEHRWDFGWYNWGGTPTSDRIIYFKTARINTLNETQNVAYRPELVVTEVFCGDDGTWGDNYHAIRTAGTVHSQGREREVEGLSSQAQQSYAPGVGLDADYHMYGMLWEPDGVTYYFDGTAIGDKIMQVPTAPYDHLTPILALRFGSSDTTLTPYTRTINGGLRAYNFDGDQAFDADINHWLYSNIEGSPITSAGVSPWITKVNDGGLVTRFVVRPSDPDLYGKRTQFGSHQFELYHTYRIELEFKLDSSWNLSMGSVGEGLLWQAKGLPKSGQFSNAAMSLNIRNNELWFAILYPKSGMNATVWPTSLTWSNGTGTNGYVETNFSVQTITTNQYYRVRIDLYADDRPPQFGGQGYCNVYFNDALWISHTGPNHHPDQNGDHRWDFGWYNWGGTPTSDRILFYRKANIKLLDSAPTSPADEPDGTTPTGDTNAMEIDYLRAWQLVDYADVPTGQPTVAPSTGTPPVYTPQLVLADRVKEVSTSTGTGDFTLNGALVGHQTFLAVCNVGDTFYGCIEAVDAFGIPTGQWEVGLYTFGVGNTVQRTTVYRSSNSNGLVNFTQGNKFVFLDLGAAFIRTLQQVPTTNPPPPPPPPGGGGTPTNHRPYILNSSGQVIDTNNLYGDIVFQDEFTGTSVNTAVWRQNWHPNAARNYDVLTYVDNGVTRSCLRMWPHRDTSLPNVVTGDPDDPQNQFYRNELSSVGPNGFQMHYGYIEIRAKLNKGRGLFPAFWLFNDGPQDEIDIMEAYGQADGYYANSNYDFTDWAYTAHLPGGGRSDHQVRDTRKAKDQLNGGNPLPPLTNQWHTWGLHWDQTQLRVYYDGVLFRTTPFSGFAYTNPMYIIVDGWIGYLGFTADYPTPSETPTGTGNSLEVDWIRVWSLK